MGGDGDRLPNRSNLRPIAIQRRPGGETIIPLTVDWERYPKELLDQEGKMDEQFIEWMDEYGSNIHHRPAIDPTMKVPVASSEQPLALLDRLDELDDLYDRQMLMDDYSPFSDQGPRRRCIHGPEFTRS